MTTPISETSGISRAAPQYSRPVATTRASGTFASVLQDVLRRNTPLKFSSHAMERMRQRGITLTSQEQARLEAAVETARSKGAREVLVLMNRTAFIVSVPNTTVITATSCGAEETTCFTNIDCAVVVSHREGEEQQQERDWSPIGEVLMPPTDRSGI